MHHRLLVVVFAGALVACGASELGFDGGSDATGIYASDAGPPPAEDGSTITKNTALVRLAQLAPLLGAVDFCLRAKDATYFDGPYFFAPKSPDAGEAGTNAAASYPGVSRYVQVPATGATDVAIVAAGQGSCLSPKLTGMVTIDPNKRLTIAVMGATKDADAGVRALGISMFVDDTTSHADAARLRIIHGALGIDTVQGPGTLSASVGFGNSIAPVAATIHPRQASSPSNVNPIVDALGYHDLVPIAGLSSLRFVAVNPQGGPWSTAAADLGLASNAVRTAFVVSVQQGLGVIVCSDLPSGGDTPCAFLAVK